MLLRTLSVVSTSRWRGPLPLSGTSVLRLRVMPADLDSNLHMNNGRYFSVADLGRFDHGLRCGLWKHAFARGWRPMAGDADGRFSASLGPLARFELHTRLLGWDDKWFFVEHRFVLGERVAALIAVRYLFKGREGKISTAAVLAASGHDGPSPTLPDWLARWRDAQDTLIGQLKNPAAVISTSSSE